MLRHQFGGVRQNQIAPLQQTLDLLLGEPTPGSLLHKLGGQVSQLRDERSGEPREVRGVGQRLSGPERARRIDDVEPETTVEEQFVPLSVLFQGRPVRFRPRFYPVRTHLDRPRRRESLSVCA